MKIKKLICSILSCLILIAVFAGCADVSDQPLGGTDEEEYYEYPYDAVHESDSRMIQFYSSDRELDAFLNDYTRRHMRATDDRIHTHPVGAGSTAWKEWESMIGSWWDASAENGTMPSFYATKDLVRDWLISPVQDVQGYVWADDGSSLSSWGMGWAFPDYTLAGKGWFFDTANESEGWSAENAAVSVSDSVLIAQSEGAVEEIAVVSPKFEISTLISPFLRLGFGYEGSEAEDVYIYYQTEDSQSWTESQRVSFSQMCLNGAKSGSEIPMNGYYLPMYLQENWGASITKRVTRIKIVVKARRGETLTGSIALDYLCTEYDDRQPINPCNYILAAKNICEFDQDAGLLTQILPKARAAMNFLLNQLQGKEGLLSTHYLVGHSNDGMKSAGYGIGNGYWDVLAFPEVNLYCNISFYNALRAMAYLENMASHFKVEVEEVKTLNAGMDDECTYAETAESLTALAETCREKIRSEFWNEETGRFHAGLRDYYGDVQDNGYLMFNEQVIASGIATQEQTESVMSWINGERTVRGDLSSGDDIYTYEFAPRFNTAEIGSDFYWGYSAVFGGNVQDGGTALHLAYYDLVAQSAISKNTSFERLKAIQSWYEKVKAAGGTGQDFYRAYYDKTDISVQGGDSSGTIGVDYEFLEAALLFCAVPDAYFGLDTSYDGTLIVAPRLPSELDFWRMENLTFAGRYYDLSAGQFFVQISAVSDYRENAVDAKIEIRMQKPSFDFKILLNGEETSDYRIDGDRIVVRADFADVKAEIKKV